MPPHEGTTGRALDGITVLELGQAFMGPYCALLMQRLGADVIKVEPPTGEPYRRPTARKGVEAVQFGLLNAGKRSLSIDLKHEEGLATFLNLVESADVIIQNYAPGAFDRLVGIERVRERNPRVIVASGSGYGSTGPLRGIKAMDLTVQAMAGVMATTGFPDAPPVRTGPAVVDFMGGAHLFGAVMSALFQRESTGRGQEVEVALYDAILPSLASNIGGYFDSDGTIPERTGNRHGGLAVVPYNAFEAADGWLGILCLHDQHWAELCRIMDRPDLVSDERCSTNAQRVLHMEFVDRVVADWCVARPVTELIEVLNAAAIPCAPVQSLREVMDSPQTKARGMLEHHRRGDYEWWTLGSPIRLSDSPPPTDNIPRRLGEDTTTVLTDLLQLTPDRITHLIDDKAVVQHCAPRPSGCINPYYS